MTDAVAILVPVLARPHLVAGLIDNIARTTPSEHTILFLTDPDDHAERAAIAAAGATELPCGGSWATKINLGIAATTTPLIFLGADDLRFHPDWLGAATRKLKPGIGLVGTNDLGNPRVMRGELATHALVARWYTQLGAADGGALLHEGYEHNFVDQELTETAKRRGAFAFARFSHVEHLHPHWGKSEIDATYEKGLATFARDRRTYRARRSMWT